MNACVVDVCDNWLRATQPLVYSNFILLDFIGIESSSYFMFFL